MKNSNEITSDLYKGSALEKSFSHQEPLTFEKAEQTIKNNFERNLINQDTFDKAMEELDILKGGKGSGRIHNAIAKTKEDRDKFHDEIKNLMPDHHIEKLGDLSVQIEGDKSDLEDAHKMAKKHNIKIVTEK